MKKSFITKEYTQESMAGTFSMLEKRNFFGSKILEIEDEMVVTQNSIIWTESNDNTQEVNIDDQTRSVNTTDLKGENQEIRIYPEQSDNDVKKFTKWQLAIDVDTIIRTWIFAQLKKNRTFAKIRNSETNNTSIDDAIYDYIDYNIMPRIKFKTILLYVRYFEIGQIDNTGNVALKYDTRYTESTIVPPPKSGESTEELLNRTNEFKESILVSNFDLDFRNIREKVEIIYTQIKSSEIYKFDYYFDVVYEKA